MKLNWEIILLTIKTTKLKQETTNVWGKKTCK